MKRRLVARIQEIIPRPVMQIVIPRLSINTNTGTDLVTPEMLEARRTRYEQIHIQYALDPLGDASCNAHLVALLLDAVVGALEPALVAPVSVSVPQHKRYSDHVSNGLHLDTDTDHDNDNDNDNYNDNINTTLHDTYGSRNPYGGTSPSIRRGAREVRSSGRVESMLAQAIDLDQLTLRRGDGSGVRGIGGYGNVGMDADGTGMDTGTETDTD